MGTVLQSIQIVLGVVQIATHDLPDGAICQHLLKNLRQLLRQVIAALFGKGNASRAVISGSSRMRYSTL